MIKLVCNECRSDRIIFTGESEKPETKGDPIFECIDCEAILSLADTDWEEED